MRGLFEGLCRRRTHSKNGVRRDSVERGFIQDTHGNQLRTDQLRDFQ